MGVMMSYIGLAIIIALAMILIFVIVVFYKLEAVHQIGQFKNSSIIYKNKGKR